MHRWFLVGLVALGSCLLLGRGMARAADTPTPLPPPAGITDGAVRVFVPSGPRDTGAVYVIAACLRLTDRQLTQDALDNAKPLTEAVTQTMVADFYERFVPVTDDDSFNIQVQDDGSFRAFLPGTMLDEVHQVSMPTIGDWSVAYGTKTENDEYFLSFILFSLDRYLFVTGVIGHQSDPLVENVAIAEQVVSQLKSGTRVDTSAHRTDGAFAALPALTDMPIGFQVEREYILTTAPQRQLFPPPASPPAVKAPGVR